MIQEIVQHWPNIVILMVAIFVYSYLIDKVFFRPVQRILNERKARIRDATNLVDESRNELDRRFAEYEDAILSARRKGLKIKEDARQEADAHRKAELDKVRQAVAAELKESEAELVEASGRIRKELEQLIPGLAREMAKKILGREVAA
ncbi:MAG: ATP synthase F0 subunit B [Acidobacteriota bacterium]